MIFSFGFTTLYFAAFFAVVFGVYWIFPKKYRWIWLLISSVIFYLLCSWQSAFFILFTSLSMYGASRYIEHQGVVQKDYLTAHPELDKEGKKQFKKTIKRRKKTALILGIVSNLLVLGVMKYLNFAIWNINGIIHWFNDGYSLSYVSWFLPLGISFYTFQAIGYLVDVYWALHNLGEIAEEEEETGVILFPFGFAPIHIDEITDCLEGVKGDA